MEQSTISPRDSQKARDCLVQSQTMAVIFKISLGILHNIRLRALGSNACTEKFRPFASKIEVLFQKQINFLCFASS